jgi:hypothetical protein
MTNLRFGQSRTPGYVEALESATTQAINELFVAMPGRVVKYNAATQTADIKPLLKRAYIDDQGNEDLDDLAVLPNVPVMFPRAGGFFLSFPLAVNDNVLLLFMDRSIDSFMSSSGSVALDPVDLREHDISDAIALPGFFTTPRALKDQVATDAVFGKEQGAQVHAKNSTIEITTAGAPAATDFVALSSLVAAELNKLSILFNAATGHTHSSPAGGSTGTPSAVFVPGSVASKNLKAD